MIERTKKSLEKNYREVRTCKVCGRFYGIDNNEMRYFQNMCPLCIKSKAKRTLRILNRIKEIKNENTKQPKNNFH